MYICKYCSRHYKEKYEVCPNCGGKSFRETAYLGGEVIYTPPREGYTINYKNFEKKLKSVKNIKYIGLAIALVFISFSLPFVLLSLIFSDTESQSIMLDFKFLFFLDDFLIALTIFIISFVISKKKERKVKEDIEKVKKLSKFGILVKGIPFELISDGSMILGKPYRFYIKVTYENASGVKIPLVSSLTYNTSNIQDKKTVDLLIDPNDYSNFYIDYEIY